MMRCERWCCWPFRRSRLDFHPSRDQGGNRRVRVLRRRTPVLALLEGATRGDPESPLLWTSRSVVNLALALREQGIDVSDSTVRRQLRRGRSRTRGRRRRLQ